MLPYSFIGAGTYSNGATVAAVDVPLSDSPDWFFVKDLTNWGNPAAGPYSATSPVYAEWFSSMAPGSYLSMGQSAVAAGAASLFPSRGTSGGFTFIDLSNPPTYAALPATGINNATFVVAMANTGDIAVGDWVKVINPVGMLQMSGLIAQVTAVTTNVSITLGYVASAVAAGLTVAAPAISASIIKIIPNGFYPKGKQVLYVSQAAQAVVYFAGQSDYTPGQLLDFSIPVSYGMIQLNSLTALSGAARVLSVTNSATVSSVTLDLNSVGYTAFAYPASASYVLGKSPPWSVPAGSGVVPGAIPVQTNLSDAFDNRNRYIMRIGTSACGVANATMQWVAMKADYSNLSNA